METYIITEHRIDKAFNDISEICGTGHFHVHVIIMKIHHTRMAETAYFKPFPPSIKMQIKEARVNCTQDLGHLEFRESKDLDT